MGVLPFRDTGELTEQGGEPVVGAEAIPVSVWASAPPRSNDRGRGAEYTAEAPLEWADALLTPNRELQVAGVTYRVQTCVPHTDFPHVALTLSRMTG